MTPHDAVLITVFTLIFITPVIFIYWWFSYRPTNKQTSQGHLNPKIMLGLRWGGSGISEATVRGCAATSLLFGLGFAALVHYFGYQWWFGIASFCFFWMVIMYLDVGILPPRFRPSMRLFGLGVIPTALAFGFAWASYCEWISFPDVEFQMLNSMSLAIFLYIAARPIPNNVVHQRRRRAHR